MSTIRELRNEATLSLIAANKSQKNQYLLFGVIIDISEPYQTEKSTNFTTKLKIIDPSFNYKQKIDAEGIKFFKFAYINIYSELPEYAPRI